MENMSLTEFSKILASKAPVPGGGGASAAVGAFGCSLGAMVCALTIGKKRYREYEEEIKEINQQLDILRLKFLELIDKDAEAFKPLSEAYSLPKETQEQLKIREEVLEKALKEAMEPPFEMLVTAAEAVKYLMREKGKCSVLAVSDLGVAASFIDSAASGAALNVFANTKLMKNRDYAELKNSETESMLQEVHTECNEILNYVKSKCN